MSTFLKLEKRIFAILLAAIMALSLLPALTIPVQAEPETQEAGTTLIFSVTLKTEPVAGTPVLGDFVKGNPVADVAKGALPDNEKPAYIKKATGNVVYEDKSGDSEYEPKADAESDKGEVKYLGIVYYKKTTVGDFEVEKDGFVYPQKESTEEADEFVAQDDGHVYYKKTGNHEAGQAKDADGYIHSMVKGNPEGNQILGKDGYIYYIKSVDPDTENSEQLVNGLVYKKTYEAKVKDPKVNNGVAQTVPFTPDKNDEEKGIVKYLESDEVNHTKMEFTVKAPKAEDAVAAGGSATISGDTDDANKANISLSGTPSFTYNSVSGEDVFFGNCKDEAKITGLTTSDKGKYINKISYSATSNANLVSINGATITSNKVVTESKTVTIKADIVIGGKVYDSKTMDLTVSAPSEIFFSLKDDDVKTGDNGISYITNENKKTVTYSLTGTGVSPDMLDLVEGSSVTSYDPEGTLVITYDKLVNDKEYSVSVNGFDNSATFKTDFNAPKVELSVPDFYIHVNEDETEKIFVTPKDGIDDEQADSYTVEMTVTITDPEGNFNLDTYLAGVTNPTKKKKTDNSFSVVFEQEVTKVGDKQLPLPKIEDFAGNVFQESSMPIETSNGDGATLGCTVNDLTKNIETNPFYLDAESPFEAPGITFVGTDTNENGLFSGNSITAKVKMSDGKDGSGIDTKPESTEYKLTGTNAESVFKGNLSGNLPLNKDGEGSVSFTINDNSEQNEFAFSVTVHDNARNYKSFTEKFNVDNKEPTISGPTVSSDATANVVDGIEYYNKDLTYSFDVTDLNLITTKDKSSISVQYVYAKKGESGDGKEVTTTHNYEATITGSGDGKNTFDGEIITFEDKAEVNPGQDETGILSISEDGTKATIDFTITEGELQSYSVTAVDSAGNKSDPKSESGIKKIVDQTAPVVTVTMSDRVNMDGTTEYHDAPVAFNISVKDIYYNIGKYNKTVFTTDENGTPVEKETYLEKDEDLAYTYKTKEPIVLGEYPISEKPNAKDSLYKYVIKAVKAVFKDCAENTPDKQKSSVTFDNTDKNENIKINLDNDGEMKFADNYTLVVDLANPFIDPINPEENAVNFHEEKQTYYFNEKQNVIVKVSEINLNKKKSWITYTTENKGEETGVTKYFSDADYKDGVYTFTIPVEDGMLLKNLKVQTEDLALRKSAAEDKNEGQEILKSYITDTTDPSVNIAVTGTNVKKAFVNGNDVYVTFKNPASAKSGKKATQDKEKVKLTVTVTDCNIATREKGAGKSGFESDVFFVTNNMENDKDINGICKWTPSVTNVNMQQTDITVKYEKEIEVAPDTSGTIRFDLGIIDLAGNVPNDATVAAPLTDTEKGKLFNAGTKQEKASTIGKKIVADRERPSSNNNEKMTPEIILNPEPLEDERRIKICDLTDKNGNKFPLYKDSVTYNLTVYDPEFTDEDGTKIFSGIRQVSWSVWSDVNGLITTSESPKAYDVTGIQKKKYSIPVTITKDGETNNIILKVTAIDWAGNTTTRTAKLAIDKLSPRVTISYINNSYQNKKYFKDKRYATVLVTDLNFDASKTVITTTFNKSNVQLCDSKWTSVGNNTWKNVVRYENDGDYTFAFKTADKAKNPAVIDENIYSNYGKNAAPREFTIDTIPPRITVTFDNNNVSHEKYYNADRTATINIVEHNFDENIWLQVPGTASIDGTAFAFPGRSRFTGGDSHNATIPFTREGDYSFTVSYTDLAGNRGNAVPRYTFTIDKTKPEAVIGNVENHKAYRGEIRPTVTLTDINFNSDDYEITWTATKFGSPSAKQQLKGAAAGINHGVRYTFNDLERLPKNDGIYTLTATLTDMAGNSFTTEPVMYSVNRFGSVYEANNQETTNLVNNPFTNKSPSISVRETNPDVLKSYSVSISVNGTTKKLKEGTDYTISRSETDAAWKRYVYDIADSVFKDVSGNPLQGSYVITLHSKDGADNKNSNRTNNEANKLDMEFVIDNEPASGYVSVQGLGENNNRIQKDKTDYTVYWEDNFHTAKVQIYLNGKVVETLEGERLEAAGGSYTLTVNQETFDQTIYAVLTDAAGNERTLDEVTFFLNASGFAQFLHNPVALICTIAGLLVVIGLIIFLVVRKKKKAGY